MAEKLKPCTQPKHAWDWIKNRDLKSVTMNSKGTTVHIRTKGVYRCKHCSEVKYGQMRWVSEPDFSRPNN